MLAYAIQFAMNIVQKHGRVVSELQKIQAFGNLMSGNSLQGRAT